MNHHMFNFIATQTNQKTKCFVFMYDDDDDPPSLFMFLCFLQMHMTQMILKKLEQANVFIHSLRNFYV
jgi:hypothetical protein